MKRVVMKKIGLMFIILICLLVGCGENKKSGGDSGWGSSSSDTVEDDIVPPTANAGPDQTVYIGVEVILNGSKSIDPDGEELNYKWEMTSLPPESSVLLSDPNNILLVFTPDVVGEYIVSLIVSNGNTESLVDAVLIEATVIPPLNVYSLDIFGNIDEYLGCWSCDASESESIHNPDGLYGSAYGVYSIRNNYGQYGSEYSSSSACNSFATSSPSLYYGDLIFNGRLSVNIYKTNGICNPTSYYYSKTDCLTLGGYCFAE
jgi:hypothetical protein